MRRVLKYPVTGIRRVQQDFGRDRNSGHTPIWGRKENLEERAEMRLFAMVEIPEVRRQIDVERCAELAHEFLEIVAIKAAIIHEIRLLAHGCRRHAALG